MVRINVNDFVEILTNPEVKLRLNEIFTESIQAAVQKCIDNVKNDFQQLTSSISAKVDELNTTVSTLRLQLESKDAVISSLQHESSSLRAEIAKISAQHDETLQEAKRDNLILTGFVPTYSEAAAGGNGQQRISTLATTNKVISFLQDQLAIPEINERDISSAVFLPAPKSHSASATTGRLLVVRFTRRMVRDAVLSKRGALKEVNRTSQNKYFINEDLTAFRRKLFADARSAFKANKLSGAWTSGGNVFVKTNSGRVVHVQTIDALNELL
jgi:hypothetical protein